MSYLHSSFSTPQSLSKWVISFFVILIHIGALGIGIVWKSPELAKPRSKLIVQTIPLKPFEQRPPVSQHSTPIAASIVTLPLKEEAPIIKPQEQILPEKEDAPLPKQEIKPLATTQSDTPAPNPITPPAATLSSVESPPSLAPKKPPASEAKKTVKKTIAPVKKTVESEKKSTAKPSNENEKKRQQERVEAEKKRQQEQSEIEKKRQKELADQKIAKEKERTLLAKARENLAKVNETREKISSSSLNLEAMSLPKELSLQVDALATEDGSLKQWGIKESSYTDELEYRLKHALKLPDYGAVKIKLTLDRMGKVVKMEITQSESSKNKTYVENKIPTLVFSSFGEQFQGMSQHTFAITLQTEF